jgi:hypothetical protein
LTPKLSDPFAQQLVESARTDSPEPGARDRALLGLGLAPVGLLAVAPPAAAAPGAAGVLAVSSKAVPWVVGKSLAIGLLGSVVALGVLDRTLGSSTPPAAVPHASAGSTAARTARRLEPVVPSPQLVAPTTETPPSAGKVPTLTPSSAEPPESSSAPLGAPASAPAVVLQRDSLLQLEALARVRRLLSAHESKRALALLDDFERRFPASQVAEEAAVLRIETLRALGRTSEARALGLQFSRERPFSVYREKVSTITRIP